MGISLLLIQLSLPCYGWDDNIDKGFPMHRIRIRSYICSLILVLGMSGAIKAQDRNPAVTSPDGDIKAEFTTYHSPDSVFARGELVYSVSYKGEPLIQSSALNLQLENRELPLGTHVQILDISEQQGLTQSYNLIHGRSSTVHEEYNSLAITLESQGPRKLQFGIEARAYNDGIAFRYTIPKQAWLDSVQLVDEKSEFRFADDAIAYAQQLPHYRSMYESEYVPLPISALGNRGGVSSTDEVLVGLPLLLELPGKAWAAITDTNLEGYASAYLRPTGGWTGYRFETDLSPKVEAPELAVTSALPFETSWKAIMIADRPGRFIESNLVTSLNPPSRIEDTSWIQAGKSTWDWWSGSLNAEGESAYTTENMKRYVDFAAKSGFRYMLIDAGWSDEDLTQPIPGRVDVPEVVNYAAQKEVKVWIWAYYDAVKQQMEKAFSSFEEWGVAGVKVDFIERDDQAGIKFYYDVARSAAAHHLMLDFHGSTKPTGIQRTWPNIMGYEAVVGMEQSKAGRRDNPRHHVMLPFTRMLPGLMDYTPGGFDNVTLEGFTPRMLNPEVMGTRSHHLAMYVVYESPFQMVSDHPSAYRNEPSFEFIKDVPTSWDQTKVLDGQPGEYITIARKSVDRWFVGAMTNEEERQLKIPLSFLGGGSYNATIYRDASDSGRQPKHVVIEEKEVGADDMLNFDLAPAGGAAIKFTPR